MDFANSGLDVGKHHWTKDRWMAKGREYLTNYLGWTSPTGFEVAAIVLLLYHSFGPSKGKPMDITSPIFLALLEEGIIRYKCIPGQLYQEAMALGHTTQHDLQAMLRKDRQTES